jgi:hypothetical protein
MTEVRARQTFARLVAHVRETQFQIGMHDAPARARNAVQQGADTGADSRDNAVRQKGKGAQQTCHQTDQDSTFHKAGPGGCWMANTPAAATSTLPADEVTYARVIPGLTRRGFREWTSRSRRDAVVLEAETV